MFRLSMSQERALVSVPSMNLYLVSIRKKEKTLPNDFIEETNFVKNSRPWKMGIVEINEGIRTTLRK